jgi:DNA-binding transcriptional MerR regulator
MAEELLTIKEIARRLDLPESNVRYYRDKFEEYLPHIGLGRKRRYLPQSLEVLSLIAECLKTNVPSEEIAMELSRRYPRSPQVQEGQTGLALKRADSDTEPISALLKSQAKALEDLSGLLKSQSEQAPRVDGLRSEQQLLKKALVLLWRKQQRIEELVWEKTGPGRDSGMEALLERIQALEAAARRDESQERVEDRTLQSERIRCDEQFGHLSARMDRLDENLRSLTMEQPAAPPEDLLSVRIAGLEERVHAVSLEMAQEMERVEQSLLEIRREPAALSRIDDLETRMAELASQGELETIEQGLLRLSGILERFGDRIETVETGMAALSCKGELDILRTSLTRLDATTEQLGLRLEEQASMVEELRAETRAVRPALEHSMNELASGLDTLGERVAALESKGLEQPEATRPSGDLTYLSATMSRLNHSLETVTSRIAGLEQKLGSEVDRLNTYVHTCWSGVQKLSKALKSNG